MTAELEDVANKTFDYIIVGGGTAGLVLAARLSEDPSTSVLVLEAGAANFDDPDLQKCSETRTMTGASPPSRRSTPTITASTGAVERRSAGARRLTFFLWNNPPAIDIDAWEPLGNPGWNWKNFLKYSKRSETWFPPSAKEVQTERLTYDPEFHGTDGPLSIGFCKTRPGWDVVLQDTLVNLGVDVVHEPLAGKPVGSFMAASAIHPRTQKRAYSLDYYNLAAGRPNLTVLVSASASRVLTSGADGKVAATGIEFVCEGETRNVSARKEVLLCAGAIKSPQLLELSGIGDPAVLSQIGVEVKAALPGVGANVQEHLFAGMSWELNEPDNFNTLDALRDPANVDEQLALYANGTGLFTLGIAGIAMLPLEAVSTRGAALHAAQAEKVHAGAYAPGLRAQYERQLGFYDARDGDVEILSFPGFLSFPKLPEPGKKYVAMCAAINHPFSRGTIHAASTDPNAQPTIDPHLFEEDIDLQTFVEQVKFIRKVAGSAPMADLVGQEVGPGPDVQTDDQIATWLKKDLHTTFHSAGSCSMLPLHMGGVVDPALKVYHTENIRVIDMSIMPLHIAAHPQGPSPVSFFFALLRGAEEVLIATAAVYAIAEQAADIIKGKFVA
ncbi:hypothetical protein EW146_g9930 [Bondarzewia mesenterica]|uniref:Glucose-methanol-choline oxidoreductase N-terminal domain-containing protein n=1 Tax=Bondarzewia mesenterica TaxID=1095465 RepID=A0A4S4L220_9AGAM|nr:hypothetical protein EW146_g9930 [Bondarzewia mesenterica]